jgi:hypothetical protein
MRDANRLDDFYNELKKIHKEKFPDWRFGQFCSNFFGWLMSEKKIDLFFPEEDEMIEYIKEYAEWFNKSELS